MSKCPARQIQPAIHSQKPGQPAMTVNAQTMLELADEIEKSHGLVLMLTSNEWPTNTAQLGIKKTAMVIAALRSPAIAGVAAREAGKLLGAFRKVVSVMKGARNTADHLMCVWSDDMKAAEDVAAFLETLAALPPSQEVPAPPQADGVREADIEIGARAIAQSYGYDPDSMASVLEMCTADNKPVPYWRVYEEQAEACLRALASEGKT